MATVAAFDFDKTLSTRENVVPFLRAAAGTPRFLVALGASAPRLVAARLRDDARDAAKAAVVKRALAGRDAEQVAALGRRFADRVVARHLRPDLVARAGWHRRAGHRLVLVSASLGAYLRPVGEQLGFDVVLATELVVGADGRLTGELAGANVRRAEKVRRLDEWIDRSLGHPVVVWAYGDGIGDRELLARADHAILVARGLPALDATPESESARQGPPVA